MLQLSSSPNTGRWAHARLLALLVFVQVGGAALLVLAALWGLPAGLDMFVFMAAEVRGNTLETHCTVVKLMFLYRVTAGSLRSSGRRRRDPRFEIVIY